MQRRRSAYYKLSINAQSRQTLETWGISMITSVTNKKVKWVVQLNKRSGLRRKEDVFTAEGTKMFLEAPEHQLKEIYISEGYSKTVARNPSMIEIKEKLDKCSCEIVSDEVFSRMSDTQTPQGILCILRQFHYTLADMEKSSEPPLFLILESLQDPGNLGTILRAGEGAGVTGVIMSRDTVDIYNPKTIRSTMGSIYRVPFLYTEELIQTIREMKKSKISLYAAHLMGEKNYDEGNYIGGTGFLIGNEGNGLTKELAAAADTCIKIPMKGQVESLNAAVASSLLMYEAARQRRG